MGRRIGEGTRGPGLQGAGQHESGFAFTLGRDDGSVSLEEIVAHVRALDEATALPLSVDLENGYGPAPEDAALAVTRAAEAGAVGGSIEDFDPEGRIYDREHAVERIRAAAEAARRLGFPFTLTARAENHIRGNPDLEDTLGRLRAFADAGADVLYAPGLRSGEEIAAVCAAVAKPVNVLALPGMSLSAIVDAGAQRISVGGGFAWAAVNGLVAAVEELRASGSFAALSSPPDLTEWLGG